MARPQLDDAAVALAAEQSRFGVLWDTGLWGFGCRFSAREPPRYLVYFRTRVMGIGHRHMIGSSPHISCRQARRIAPHQLARKAKSRERA